MKIVALCGRAQVGKDTTADFLIKKYGFKKMAFADHLKQVAELSGWNGMKDTKGRIFLQHLGDVIREYDKDLFVKNIIEKIKWYEKFCTDHNEECLVAISDVRLPDEINALKKLDASIWLIKRNTDLPIPSHVTELMDENSYPFDFIFDNNGSFEQLYSGIEMAMEKINEKA